MARYKDPVIEAYKKHVDRTLIRENLKRTLATLFRTFVRGGVEFIVIGGAAARVHGAARVTDDLEVVYARSQDNAHAEPLKVFGVECLCVG